jgi:pyruvate dehydrogenase E1 component alpha subunit
MAKQTAKSKAKKSESKPKAKLAIKKAVKKTARKIVAQVKRQPVAKPAKKMVTVKAAALKAPASKATSSGTKIAKEKLLAMYREMLTIRRFEEKAGQLYGMGLIGGFCHLYIGQEAVVIGMQHAAKKGDAVITTYRDHGHMIACGMDLKGIMAELTGRIGGFSKGKGGSMHMFSVAENFFGGHGIVGANVPLGTGMAFAQKYKGTDHLTMCYFGDGASNQGQVYESFNMASLWQLPVIYIIENNEYAMGTSTKRSHASTELYKRGEAFAIPGMQVDGMDVLKVYEAGKQAIAHVRSGKGPMLMEIKTYRYRGHSMSDPAKYRSKEEVEKYKEQRDAIQNFRDYLTREKLADEAVFRKIEDEVKALVNDAAEFAKESPEPEATELWTDVLSS